MTDSREGRSLPEMAYFAAVKQRNYVWMEKGTGQRD